MAKIPGKVIRHRLLYLKELTNDAFGNLLFYDFARYVALNVNDKDVTYENVWDMVTGSLNDVATNKVFFRRSPIHGEPLPMVFQNLCAGVKNGLALRKHVKQISMVVWDLKSMDEDQKYDFMRVLRDIVSLSRKGC